MWKSTGSEPVKIGEISRCVFFCFITLKQAMKETKIAAENTVFYSFFSFATENVIFYYFFSICYACCSCRFVINILLQCNIVNTYRKENEIERNVLCTEENNVSTEWVLPKGPNKSIQITLLQSEEQTEQRKM